MWPFLDRSRRNARNRSGVGLPDGGEVTDDEDLRMTGNREVGLDEDPAGAIERYAEGVSQWRGLDAGTPQHRTRRNGLLADTDLMLRHVGEDRNRHQLHAQARELPGRFRRDVRREW